MSTVKNHVNAKNKRKSNFRTKDWWSKSRKRRGSHSSLECQKKHLFNSKSRMSTVLQCKRSSRWVLFTSNSRRSWSSNISWWSRWKKVGFQCRRHRPSHTRFLLISWASKWSTREIREGGRPRNPSFLRLKTGKSKFYSRRSCCKFNKDLCSKLKEKDSICTSALTRAIFKSLRFLSLQTISDCN